MQQERSKWIAMEENYKLEIQRMAKRIEELELNRSSGRGTSHEGIAGQLSSDSSDGRSQMQTQGIEVAPAPDTLIKQLQAEVDRFFNSRSLGYLKQVFDAHADAATGAIHRQQLAEALEALGMRLSEEELSLALQAADLDASGGLTFEEFRRAAQCPLKLEEWAATLPLAALLCRCLSFARGGDPLREAAGLGAREQRAAVEAFAVGAGRLITEALGELRQCFDLRSEAAVGGASAKFQTFSMSAGGIDDFHLGLAGRVGDPHPELGKGMREEHCEMAGCDSEFVTSNYGVRTTPRREYDITTGARECPADQMTDRRGRVVRVVRRIADVMELPMVSKAGLLWDEVVALMLYTGPMFQVYNTILRRYPAHEYKLFQDGQNLYATTIHVLVSGVMKLSRTQSLPSGLDLYRGLGGLMELPEAFYRADERGCKGYMEWGFLSTTSDKAAALEYSGIKEGRPLATLLRLTTGSADRPACIHELSQYPGEREYLYVPCSYLEPLRGGRTLELVRGEEAGGEGEAGAVVGAVEVVAVRINANLKGLTVEELEGRKKALHLAAFRYTVREAARELGRTAGERGLEERLARDPSRVMSHRRWVELGGRPEDLAPGVSDGEEIRFTAGSVLSFVIGQAEAVLARHAGLPNEAFASNEGYRRLVDEMLRALQAPAAALAVYFEDPTRKVDNLMRTGLMDGLRRYQAHLWRGVVKAGGAGEGLAEAAGRVCVSLGLMATSPNEEDSERLTALMCAAADGAPPRALRCLVWAGGQLERCDALQRTALFLAAQYGHAHSVEELGRLGAQGDVIAEPGFESTPAYIASEGGHVEVIEALGRLGADVRRPVLDGRTPLCVAAQYGHVAVVLALHRLKADIHAPNKDGCSPIFQAAWKGHVEAVRVLHSLNADINAPNHEGVTPLGIATRGNFADVVEALQGMGAQ